MPKINLRDLYPDFYKADCIIDVPEEVLGVFVEHERREAAYRRRVYYHKAHYILGVSKTEIAKAEGVAKSRITESIEKGLRNMEVFLKGVF